MKIKTTLINKFKTRNKTITEFQYTKSDTFMRPEDIHAILRGLEQAAAKKNLGIRTNVAGVTPAGGFRQFKGFKEATLTLEEFEDYWQNKVVDYKAFGDIYQVVIQMETFAL